MLNLMTEESTKRPIRRTALIQEETGEPPETRRRLRPASPPEVITTIRAVMPKPPRISPRRDIPPTSWPVNCRRRFGQNQTQAFDATTDCAGPISRLIPTIKSSFEVTRG